MSATAPQTRARLTALPGRAGAAVRRARLTVVPAARSRAPRVPFVTLVSLVLLAGVVGLLLFNTSMQQASFTTTSLQEQSADLTARKQNLEMALERLRDPQRVAERAQSMGLVIPAAAGTLHLDTGRVDGDPRPATAEDGLRIEPPPPALPPGVDPLPPPTAPSGDAPTRDSDRDRNGDRNGDRDDRAGRDRDDRRDGRDRGGDGRDDRDDRGRSDGRDRGGRR